MFIPMLALDPSPSDLQFVENQINHFNIKTTGYDDYQPLAIFVRCCAALEKLVQFKLELDWSRKSVAPFPRKREWREIRASWTRLEPCLAVATFGV